MRLSLKPVVGALVLVGIYAAAGYIGVPAGVRWAVGNVLPEALNGRTTTVGEISFNPWNWTLTLENLSIDSAERPGSHMLELDRAVLDASISSLTRMAPVLDAVTIDGLRVQLTASELNNAEAEQAVEAELAQAPSEGSSGAAGLPAFSLSNVAVRNSSLRLVNTADNAEVEVSEINFSLPLISTLPDAGASSMTPALSLKINGRPLKAEGSIEGENATLALAIDQLNLAQILKAAPVTLDYDVKSAELSGNLALAFTLPKSGAPAVSASGTLTLANLEAATESGAPLAKMKSATLDVAGFDLAKQTIAVKSLAVQGPELYLNLEPQASRQKQTAGAAPAAPALAASGTQAAENKAASAEAAGGWHWSLESATIADGVVALTDKTMSPAAKVNVSGIKVAARNFSSDSGNQGEYSIAVNINGAAASSAGTLAIAPLSVKASAETKGLSLSALSPWVKHFTGYSISQGTLTTAGNFEFKDGPTPDVIWKGKANLANFSALDPKGAPLASVKDASVDVALFDLAKKTVAVNSVNVASPAVQVAFESQSSAKAAAGTAAKGTDKAANKTADATTGKAASTEAPWSWSVKSAAVTNGALGLKGIPAYANLGWNYFWCIFTIYVIVKLLSSNFGNTLRAVRDDEVAAKAMGIDTFKAKTISFVVGAFFAGIGGSLTGSLITTIDPKMFNFQLTFNILMFVVVGGLGSITGSLVGAAVVTVLLEWLRFVEDTIQIGSWEIAGIPGMRMLIFSLLLLFIILYRREGIIGGCEFSWDGAARFLHRLRKGKGGAANG